MDSIRQSMFSHKLPNYFKRHVRLSASALMLLAIFFLSSTFSLAQATAPSSSTAPEHNRIIVKLKTSLAQATEAEFTSTTPVQQMHIAPGQAKGGPVQAFMRQYSAQQLSPMYPGIIHIKKQRNWSDAQFADHIRQRFPARARRHSNAAALPELSRTYVLDLGPVSDAQKNGILQRLKADANIEFAEPVHTFSSKQIPNDPFLATSGSWGQPYADLWGLFSINAPAAWDTSTGTGVVVAVVDTGLDINHPDIAANVWTNPGEIDSNFFDDDNNGFVDDVHGWNFIFGNNDVTDFSGHGTHVAGTIAATGNNGIGIIGVAWGAQVMPLEALDNSGTGFDFNLAPAIMYAAENGADVINASWEGLEPSQSIEEAIQFATGMGVVFVAAAGNSSQDAMNSFPASSPEAITVAASDAFGNFAFFSNFGPKIDTTAPGVDILSLQASGTFLAFPVSDGYIRLSGTSMAAPHVSGVAALALSQNPAYSTEQVRQIIRSSNTSVPFDSRFGYGTLNAAAAVAVVNPLEAKINGLQFGASPIDPITISGVAQGVGFSSYVLEYGFGTQPSFFTPFFSSSTPASGTLGQLDPGTLFSGTFTIRLTAFNSSGNAFQDSTQFTLVLVNITSPVPGSPARSATAYKPGLVLPIMGTAAVGGFQNFIVEWAPNGTNDWQTTGITLSGNGTAPVANGQLATWDTSAPAQAGFTNPAFYQIRLTVNGNDSEQAFTSIYLEPDLISNVWPVFVDLSPYFSNSGVVPALNPDGTVRLAMESPNQGTDLAASWVFNLDGSFQKTTLNSFGSFHQPSAGNVDGLPGDEIVMPDFNVIRVIHPDNSFDLFTPGVDVDLTRAPLLLEDLNNDFQLESITVGSDFNNSMAYVFAWKPDGTQASGFPMQVQDNNNMKGFFNHTRVIVGDFDGDGVKDVLVQEGLTSTTYALRLFNHDGTPKVFNAPILTGIPFAMAAADLDHNGKLETILANYNGSQAKLHVFGPDGSERPGWPVDVSSSNGNFSTLASIAVGDFNRDGHEEIVFSREPGIYLFNSDGTLFPGAWPLPPVFFGYSPVVVGDVDGDGFPEIVTSINDFSSPNGARLLALSSSGTVKKSWLLPGSNGLGLNVDNVAPVLGDFNQDGTTDIAVAYQLAANSGDNPGLVTILDTHAPFNPAQMDWPMNFQNSQNNPVLLRTTASTLAVTLTSGANPAVIGDALIFTATATPAGNGSVQFLDGGEPISASIPLSNGTASFTTSALPLGSHSITARYTGDNQHSGSVSTALVETVSKGNTSVNVSLTAGSNPAVFGDTLTFTATVSPSSATGTVTFLDGSTPLSDAVPLVAGSASLSIATLPIGTHAITAQYSGDATFNAGISAALQQTVNSPKPTPVVTLALSAGTNPSVFGNSLTFTATVAPASATGTVIFFDGSVAISGNIPLSNGVAAFTTSSLDGGPHTITAQYSGDATFNSSTSNALVQNVAKLATEVDLELSVNTTGFTAGTPLTFVAKITPQAATGIVFFFDGETQISQPVPVSNGSASFTTTTLAVGSHTITARYNGDADYSASESQVHKLSIK
ncbi:MAG TPA: Ig-like domain repeat protein [Candidatus Acidoferrales bacterium]|nr:Ig-like domain repeat protein [Candidatus Acidoferrales bacterium]